MVTALSVLFAFDWGSKMNCTLSHFSVTHPLMQKLQGASGDVVGVLLHSEQ